MKRLLLLALILFLSACETSLSEGDAGRNYVAKGEKCKLIKYSCEEGWRGFNDDIGCGCEKIQTPSVQGLEAVDSSEEPRDLEPVIPSTQKANKVTFSPDDIPPPKPLEEKTGEVTWVKEYITGSVEECQTLRYTCEEGKKPFEDELGCGCLREVR